jgi:Fe-S-cluster containining protein
MNAHLNEILKSYGKLLRTVDKWFAGVMAGNPGQVTCQRGCSDCCRSMFDITLLDAWLLKAGFDRLPSSVKDNIFKAATARLDELSKLLPGLEKPYILNVFPEAEWEKLMRDDDETPCLLLDDNGLCLVYDYRPMTCRLHGLPLVDKSGEVFHDDWCTLNFAGVNPLLNDDIRWKFRNCFEKELSLFQEFTMTIFNEKINELDVFIPLAMLLDIKEFDWKAWWRENRNRIRMAGF